MCETRRRELQAGFARLLSSVSRNADNHVEAANTTRGNTAYIDATFPSIAALRLRHPQFYADTQEIRKLAICAVPVQKIFQAEMRSDGVTINCAPISIPLVLVIALLVPAL